MSSEPDTSMSMNSLMQAIYGEHHHQTQYTIEHEDHNNEQILEFMQSLINHLVELCVTQGFVDNVHRTLSPWLRQVKINYKNPKNSIEGFMKDFLRLFQQETQKINKYGQKKLKYLTQTVSKQIFTQIMRMSCDLKLQSVNRTNHLRSAHRKTNNTNILVHGVERLFTKDKMYSFKMLKRYYGEGIQKEEKFVEKIAGSINKLDHLMVKCRKSKLWKAMAMWRMSNIEMSQQESISVFTQAKQFFLSVLPAIVKTWQDKPFNWVNVIIQNLSILVKDAIGNNQGTQIQFLPNPNLQHNSLDYSALSSQRSGISQMSSISVQTYLQNQQIKYDTNNKILIMPIITQHEQIGLIKISWQYQLPITLFNRILGLVEEIKNIIQKFAKITSRLCYYQAEYENGYWHENLYNMCFREDILQFKGIQQILGLANIAYLQIYHDKATNSSCIKFGNKQNTNNLPDNIFRLIWQKLQTVQYFKLDRQNTNYSVLRLDCGFCRYSFQHEHQVSEGSRIKNMIIQCVIPLLTKNLGKIGCTKCNIKIKELHPTLDSLLEKQQKQAKIIQYDFKLMMQIKDSHHVGQVESYLYQLIRKIYEKTPVYAKLFYLVSQKNNMYLYRKSGEDCSMAAVEIPKGLVNGNVGVVDPHEANKSFKQMRDIMHSYPLFSEPEIYQYQNQKRKAFKIYPKKIGRKAILLLATYQNIPEEQIQQVTQNCGCQIEKNPYLFVKEDLYSWVSKIVQENDISGLFVKDSCDSFFSKDTYDQKLSFWSFVGKICETLPEVKKFCMWKIKQNDAIEISGKNQQRNIIRNFPTSFLKLQPVKSHQSVKGAHRILLSSKNYGQKLQEHLTYIPNFSRTDQKIKYTEAISEMMEEAGQFGQSTDSCYTQVVEFLQRAGKIERRQCQFISVPIRFRQMSYVLILVYDRGVSISQERFKAISHYLQRNLTKLLQRKYVQMKNSALLLLKNCKQQQNFLIQNKNQLARKAIMSFYDNNRYHTQRNKTLRTVINKITTMDEYKMMKSGFSRIEARAQKIKNVYVRSCQYLINKISQVYFLNPLLSNLVKIRDRRQGVNKFCLTLSQMTRNSNVNNRITSRNFFNTLLQLSETKIKSAQLKKIVSAKAILQFSMRIYRRNLLQYFSKGYQNLISLQRSLLILKQEFNLVCPKTVKTCIQFLTGRLNLMISQHYFMPICLTIVNCGYRHIENKVMQSLVYVFVRESSFAFEIKGQNGLVNHLGKLVQSVLHDILPKWQIDHRKHQNTRLRILLQSIDNVRIKNIKHLFSILHAQNTKNIIQQHSKMIQKTSEQVQIMRELQKNCNPSTNILKREKHKKQMEELKQEVNTIQNQLDKLSVEARIKSKTNAAYRMLHILNKGKGKGEAEVDWNRKVKDVKSSKMEDVFRHTCEVLPLWHVSLSNVMRKNFQAKAEHFFNRIASIYA